MKELTQNDVQALFERTAKALKEHDGQGWSALEREAVSEAIERFRYKDGSQPKATSRMLRTFARIGRRFNLTGYQVAADLEKLRIQVETGRATAPEREAWFPLTSIQRLKRARRMPVASAQEAQERSEGLGWSDNSEAVARIMRRAS